jgi:L-ascorbate 6-phosphate lactonase
VKRIPSSSEKRWASRLGWALKSMRVPVGSVAIGWLGQAGFVLKSPGGTRIAIDPYLSNSCEAIGRDAGLDFRRRVPAPLQPRELVGYDAIAITHSHQDHLDPETLHPYLRAGGRGPFIAPHESADRLASLGVAAEQVLLTWPNRTHQVGDFTIRATFAIPLAGDDLTHVGYLVSVSGGPCLYFTGDTDYNEILSISVAPHQPDVMIAVINSAFRNLSPREAAQLAKAIKPRWVVPCHHDLFADNSLPDRMLRTNLLIQGMVEAFCPLQHGVIKLFRRNKVVRARATARRKTKRGKNSR